LGRGDRTPCILSPVLDAVATFELPPPRRIVVFGCGISTEPAALAYVGHEVIAIDRSSVAVEHLREQPATRHEIAWWLRMQLRRQANGELEREPVDVDVMVARLDEERRPGGSLTLLCADMRTHVPSSAVDLVYMPWSWQCLEKDDRRTTLERAFGLLAPGGVIVVAGQNLGANNLYTELARSMERAGFFAESPRSDEFRAKEGDGKNRRADFWDRHNELWRADCRDAVQRLMRGEKMYRIFNASG
jgi:trans-aconitate methyltransferase